MNSIKKFYSSLFFSLALITCLSVQINALSASSSEQIQITTYYPSPYGSYQSLSSEIVQFKASLGPPSQVLGKEEKGMIYFDQNEGLKIYDGTKWDTVKGSAAMLVGAEHTESDCISAGGEVVNTATAFKQCRFNRSACPAGWTQRKNWTTTSEHKSLVGNDANSRGNCAFAGSYNPSRFCYISPGSGHVWADKEREQCNNYFIPQIFYKNDIVQIGCY